MADIVDFQERLNKDPQLKQKFLDNPADCLRSEGIDLTPGMQTDIEYVVDKLKRPGQMVPGAGVAPADLQAAAIRIRIVVDF